jgi:glycosyltransferase involved in cell wall biosynthesis
MSRDDPRRARARVDSNRPRTVLHVINNLPVGGAERFLVILAAAQRDLGWSPEVCTLSRPNPLAAELGERGLPHLDLGRVRFNDPRLVLDLWRRMRERRPDVVHTHLFYADTSGRLASRAAGVRVVVSTEHSTEGAVLSRRRQFAIRATAPLATRIVAVSTAVRAATARRLGVPESRLDVIPNGIEIEAFARATPLSRVELGAGPGTILVGAVGRLDDAKGYDVLIEALAHLGDPRLRLIVAGDGPRRAALADLAAARGVTRAVRWLGWRDDVPRLLATVDYVAMPSRYEGHSMALLEVMAAGRACIVSDIPELVGTAGDAALSVPRGEVVALAAALRRLADDAELRQLLGARARAAVGKFSIAESARRYLALYETLLASHGGAMPERR